MRTELTRRNWLHSALGGGAGALVYSTAQRAEAQGATAESAVAPAAIKDVVRTEVCVVGGGSGGVGAALAAARAGAEVILIEKHQVLGGTSTVAWVHSWEPSRGGGGIPKEIWNTMTLDPRASLAPEYATGEPRQGGKPLTWEPWCFDWAAKRLLDATGKCRMLLGATFCDLAMEGARVNRVVCEFGGRKIAVEAPIFIDCTADSHVCVAAGCAWRLGEDAKADFNEPSAPDVPTATLNGLTWMYRITDTGQAQTPFLPPDVEKGACAKPAALRTMANGDILVNAVGMIQGNVLDGEDFARIVRRAPALIYEHFYWMQTEQGYGTWSMAGVAPEIGVRETRRIIGEHVLSENDCCAGVKNQGHADIIAIADHAVDIHGPKGRFYELPNGAYGVPYRCLLPKGTENLFVASRGASFTHIAASSCRLSRTMITLGQAAGTAAAIGVRERLSPRSIDTVALRHELARQGVELE